MKNFATLNVRMMPKPWKSVFDIAAVLPAETWMLVGGLMVQAHARICGVESRATTDIDMLINVMTGNSNVFKVVKGLESTGFSLQEPGFTGSPFNRMKKDEMVVDVLIAEHLPSKKRNAAKVNNAAAKTLPSACI